MFTHRRLAWGLGALVLAVGILSYGAPATPPPATPPPAAPPSTLTSALALPYIVRVNTVSRLILVYQMETPNGGHLILKSSRPYAYDLIPVEFPTAHQRSSFLTTKDVIEGIKGMEDYKKEQEKADPKKGSYSVDDFVKSRLSKESKGHTILSAAGQNISGQDEVLQIPALTSDFIYLSDNAYNRILTYKMEQGSLVCVSIRCVEYDEKLLAAQDNLSYISCEEMKRKYNEWKKKQDEKNEKK